MEIRTSGTV